MHERSVDVHTIGFSLIIFLFFVNQELSVGDVHCDISISKYDYQLQVKGSLNTTCHQMLGSSIILYL